MSGRLADVENRIETVHKLAAVISAMRGIAASRAQEARRHTDSIRTYAATIGAAIGQAMTLGTGSAAPGNGLEGPQAVVLLAAEQGFAGPYNERIFEAAADLLTAPHELLVVGDRGLLVAAERAQPVDWSAAMIAHPAQATALATRITEAIYEALAEGRIAGVWVVHATPGGTTDGNVLRKRLVPFDYSRFPSPAHESPPLISLPPDQLLAQLAEEYVFAELSEAVMLAFAAENEARMRAMIAAHDNVSQSLTDLVGESRRLRQEEITEEIVELATGSLPAR